MRNTLYPTKFPIFYRLQSVYSLFINTLPVRQVSKQKFRMPRRPDKKER